MPIAKELVSPSFRGSSHGLAATSRAVFRPHFSEFAYPPAVWHCEGRFLRVALIDINRSRLTVCALAMPAPVTTKWH